MKAMKYSAAIFDLDGTLLDTLEDIADSVNEILKRYSFPQRTLGEIRTFVGNGARNLIIRSLPENTPPGLAEEFLAAYTARYSSNMKNKTRPYDGMPDLLRKLRQNGMKIAVCSNKGDRQVRELCREYFGGLVDAALGELPGIRKKPAPDSIYKVLEMLGASSHEAIYVGDSEVDVITAKNAELPFIGVSWGFRGRAGLEAAGAGLVADNADELFALMTQE